MPPERTYKLYWSPEGRLIATVRAYSSREAVQKAPMPYRQYLGEIYAEAVPNPIEGFDGIDDKYDFMKEGGY